MPGWAVVEAPAGQGGWRDQLQVQIPAHSQVTLGRSQLKPQRELGGVLEWGNPSGPWLCPGLGAACWGGPNLVGKEG